MSKSRQQRGRDRASRCHFCGLAGAADLGDLCHPAYHPAPLSLIPLSLVFCHHILQDSWNRAPGPPLHIHSHRHPAWPWVTVQFLIVTSPPLASIRWRGDLVTSAALLSGLHLRLSATHTNLLPKTKIPQICLLTMISCPSHHLLSDPHCLELLPAETTCLQPLCLPHLCVSSVSLLTLCSETSGVSGLSHCAP